MTTDTLSPQSAWQQAQNTVANLLLPEHMAKRVRALGDSFDHDHLWHPYTSATEPVPAFAVDHAHGRTLVLKDGTELLDGISSWWCCVHGYNIPEITSALATQAHKLSHVMFAGLTHQPAIDLGKRLLEQWLPQMSHIFYVDSGSVAVEVALKMALQYQHARGHSSKKNFLTVRSGYHGDTWNAMSVSEPAGMHVLFGETLPQRIFAPNPVTPFPDSIVTWPESVPEDTDTGDNLEADTASLVALEKQLASQTIAAIILEPIVQGANRMFFYHPAYLQKLRELCSQYDCLLICDEIATGFGRTGRAFACEYSGITPDIVLIGKGITAGYLTLSAALCTERVAAAISHEPPHVFMHGPTFMANPLACATACAALDYFSTYDWQGNAQRMEDMFKHLLAPAAQLKVVKQIRVLGAIAAVELTKPLSAAVASAYALQLGVWLRPMGNLLYAMLPLTTTAQEQEQIIHAMLCLLLSHEQACADAVAATATQA